MDWGKAAKAGGKMISQAAVTWGATEANDAFVRRKEEVKSREAVQLLFHQVVLDKDGRVPVSQHEWKAAGLTFKVTPLELSGLVDEPVYYVEVINPDLDGDHPKRIRHFGYSSIDSRFWEEHPTSVTLRQAPRGWHVTCPNHRDRWPSRLNAPDDNWFVVSVGGAPMKIRHFVPIVSYVATYQDLRADARQARRAVDRIRRMVDGGEDEGLQYWLTPLRSAMSEKRVIRHLVVLNSTVPNDHPNRVVAFFDNQATGELNWL
jgi:hypothetical protein